MTTAEGSTTPSKPSYSTPTKRAVINADAGPSRTPQGASPAYSSRRHSLYGIEDRIIIDPGSRVWKVGFSGEPDPRAVFWHSGSDPQGEMWDLDPDRMRTLDRKEARRLIRARITTRMRETFTKHLMTDAKSRKVIILENTYLPSFVKDAIAQVLFENLKVPSISFTSSPLLALNACGRITGLVVDVGWLETTTTPVYYSRPLFHLSRTTSLAGKALHRRVRALIKLYATYYPPPASIDNLTRTPVQPIPDHLLSESLVERIVTESCFVGGVTLPSNHGDISMLSQLEESTEDISLDALRQVYVDQSTATDLTIPIRTPDSSMGPGALVVPGWIRERATEILFADDEEAEDASLQSAVLYTLLKLPIDLRSSLSGNILVTGGTATLPGFISRLRNSLKSALLPPPTSDSNVPSASSAPLHTPASRIEERREWKKRKEEPFKDLYGLVEKIAILNDPAPMDGDGSSTGGAAGSAPRWVPSLLSWVGGSLAGMLKSGAPEMLREEYDTLLGESITKGEQYLADLEAAEVEVATLIGVDVASLRPGEALIAGQRKRGWKEGVVLRDWTRSVPVN